MISYYVILGKCLIFRLLQLIKVGVKPATLSLFTGTLSDMARSRTDLIVENALLHQQLIFLNRQVKRPQLTHRDRFLSSSSLVVPGSGNKPFTSSSQTHFYAGIGSCFDFIGGGNRDINRVNPRSHLKQLSRSGRWLKRIAYGGQIGSVANC